MVSPRGEWAYMIVEDLTINCFSTSTENLVVVVCIYPVIQWKTAASVVQAWGGIELARSKYGLHTRQR